METITGKFAFYLSYIEERWPIDWYIDDLKILVSGDTCDFYNFTDEFFHRYPPNTPMEIVSAGIYSGKDYKFIKDLAEDFREFYAV